MESSVPLPDPGSVGDFSLMEALHARRTCRTFAAGSLEMSAVSKLCFAAQGRTSPKGFRTAPSAGALYPLELFVVAGGVESLAAGVYRYLPNGHELALVRHGDARAAAAAAALKQSFIRDAQATFVICAVYERVTNKYGERGVRYTDMEAGHAAQNLLLMAGALGLCAVPVGAFKDGQLLEVLDGAPGETPLYALPVGLVAQSLSK